MESLEALPRNAHVAVFGAYGHTARFITSELSRRGATPVLSGRDQAKLEEVAEQAGVLDARVATTSDPDSLDRAIGGCNLVINCAGPFAETAPALIEAAARADVHYIDITGEILVAFDTFNRFRGRFGREATQVLLPAFGFFGALGDLAATALAAEWTEIDDVSLAFALDRWQPTRGTRLAGERRAGRRLVFVGGQWHRREATSPVAHREWDFPSPFGRQEVIEELTTVDVVTIPQHLATRNVYAYLNLTPIGDLTNPDTPPPQPVDGDGRSAQIFCVDVVVSRGGERRRLGVHGRDIYAVTAPIVVEAVARLLDGRHHQSGLSTAGEIFDADDFLRTLERAGHLRMQALP